MRWVLETRYLAPGTRLLWSELRPYPDGAREFICVLQHLLPQVQGQPGMLAQELLYDFERLGIRLAVEERSKPRAKEEDAPVRLDVGERVERRPQEVPGNYMVFERVERAQ